MLARIIIKLLGGIWRVRQRYHTDKSPWARKLYIRLSDKYFANFGSWFGIEAQFASKPIFPHGYFGIFISQQAKIGKDCVIFHQVTIGSNTLPGSKKFGSPTIGNNCYIGVGAKLIGNITIGDNVRIGANCVVFNDVPSNSVVVSLPPRVIEREQVNNRYYSMNVDGKWVYSKNGKWVEENDPVALRALSSF